MKVLLLGGTGFFGRDIARLFREAGHDVFLFTRGNAPTLGFPHIKGDRSSADDLAQAAKQENWDVVIDNLAYTGDDVRKALAAFRKAKRYLLTSTVSVYRFVKNRLAYPQPLMEDAVDYDLKPSDEDPANIHWQYARGKMEAEKAVRAQTETPWTIIRPALVYGPYDSKNRGFWYVARILKGGPLLLADSGTASFRLSYSVDVAKTYLLAANASQAEGKAYCVAQSEVVTLKDFVEASAKALGVTLETVNVPLNLLGDMGGPFASMINFVPNIAKVEAELGFRPTPFSEFTKSSALWYRDHWRGDEATILQTREEELELAARWKTMIPPLFPFRRHS